MTDDRQIHILYMEDDPGLAVLFKKKLEREGYRIDITNDSREGLSMAESHAYDIVAVDHKMPNYSGLDVIRILSVKDDCPPLIMITGTGSEEIAVEAMKTGAADYIIKDPDGYYLELLPPLIEKVLQRQKVMEEKNRAEAALRESEEKHRNLVERANDGIVIVMDGLIQFANPSMEKITGYTLGESIGRTFAEYIDSDERSRVVNNYMRRLSGEQLESIYESVIRHKDGRKIDVEFNSGLVPYKGREAVLVIIRDVTERKKTEEALRASEMKFRMLHQSMTDAFAIVDMEGHIKDYNESYRSMLGYAPEEISMLTYMDFTPEKWHEMEAAIIEKQVFTRGHSDIYEKEYRRKDGTIFPVELRTTLLRDTAGTPVSMWAIVRDISGRKRVEEERERLISELQKAISDVKQLSGMLPICASCKKIRDDKGYWKQIESYIKEHSEAEFSHGICPDCMKKLYPEVYERHFKDKND